MQFNLNEMQVMIQDGARRLLAESLDSEQNAAAEDSQEGFPVDIWSQMSQLGWVGAALPEEVGGGGLSILDLCILAEEIGRAGASLPLVSSSGFSASFLQAIKGSDFTKDLLGRMASSEVIVTPALIDEESRDERSKPRAVLKSGAQGATLSGSKVLVPFAQSAQILLVTALADNGEIIVLAIDRDAKGVNLTRHRATGGHPVFNVTFDNVAVAKDRVLATGDAAQDALAKALDTATILATAEAVGNCEGMLLLAADYATTREQFGTKIGSFQAVAHPIADMRIQTDAIRLLVFEAAWMLDQGKDVTLAVSETKAMANEEIVKMVHAGHAVHGAIGYTMEYDLQLFTRRARAFCLSYGDTHSQTERAAAALGL